MIFVFGFGAFDEWGGIEASLVVPFINFGCEKIVVFLFTSLFEAEVVFLLFLI
jgi:hypothetical protein